MQGPARGVRLLQPAGCWVRLLVVLGAIRSIGQPAWKSVFPADIVILTLKSPRQNKRRARLFIFGEQAASLAAGRFPGIAGRDN